MKIARPKPAAATPADMLEQVRAAQDEHAAAITEANQRLIETHDTLYIQAASRQETLSEQIKLLAAERDGLQAVKAAAGAPSSIALA